VSELVATTEDRRANALDRSLRLFGDVRAGEGTTVLLMCLNVFLKLAEIRRVLKLPPDQQKYVLTCSPVRGEEGELAVNSRSMLQILSAFASYVDVPKEHLDERRAVSVSGDTPVRSGKVKAAFEEAK
jgi:hypothetical protein